MVLKVTETSDLFFNLQTFNFPHVNQNSANLFYEYVLLSFCYIWIRHQMSGAKSTYYSSSDESMMSWICRGLSKKNFSIQLNLRFFRLTNTYNQIQTSGLLEAVYLEISSVNGFNTPNNQHKYNDYYLTIYYCS